jgi:hypothetical protein
MDAARVTQALLELGLTIQLSAASRRLRDHGERRQDALYGCCETFAEALARAAWRWVLN